MAGFEVTPEGFSVVGIPLLAFVIVPQVAIYWHFTTSVITSLYSVKRRRLAVFVVVVPVISFAARFAVAFPSSFVLPTMLSTNEQAIVDVLRDMDVVGHEFEKANHRFPEIGELEHFGEKLQASGRVWPESSLGKAVGSVIRVRAGVFQGYLFSLQRSRVQTFIHAVPLNAVGASSYSFMRWVGMRRTYAARLHGERAGLGDKLLLSFELD